MDCQGVVAGLRGRENLAGRGGGAVYFPFHIDKEEQLVLPDRAAEVAAKAIVVEPWMKVHLVHDELLIGCVQVAVLQVLEQHAVELVGAALHDLIELPARGMAIFRRELVCQQREFFHRIIRDDRKRTGHGLAIVVDSFDGEVVVARALSADGGAAAHTHRAAGRNAGTQQREVDHAGTGCGGGQIRDLALCECGAYLCVRRVNTRCQAAHFDSG